MVNSLKELFKKEFLLMVLLSLFFLNVYDSTPYIIGALFVYLLLNHKRNILGLDANSLLLLAFGFTYVLGGFNALVPESGFFPLWIILGPFLLYRIGVYIGSLIDSDECMLQLILFLPILFSLIHLVSIYVYAYSVGFDSTTRAMHIILTRNKDITSLRTATGISTMISPLLIYLPTALFARKEGFKVILFWGSVFSILAIVGAILITTRAPFFIVAILSLVTIMLNFRSMSAKDKIFIIFFMSLIVYGIIVLDFGEYHLTSSLYSRITDSESLSTFGSRSTRWIEGVKNIFKYPKGGEYMLDYKYYHNMWLDTYRVSGIIPMIFLLAFAFKSIGLVLRNSKNNNIPLLVRTITILFFVVCHSVFFIEPTIEGAPNFFVLFCFFFGLTNSFNKGRLSFE